MGSCGGGVGCGGEEWWVRCEEGVLWSEMHKSGHLGAALLMIGICLERVVLWGNGC